MPAMPKKAATPVQPAADNGAAKPAKGKKKTPAPPDKTPPAPVQTAVNVAVTTPPSTPVEQRQVLYPDVEAEICTGLNAITADIAKAILGWETEKDYQERSMKENPGTKPEVWSYGDNFFLRDEEGNKVRCWNNLDNRPFDDAWSRGLAQTVLRAQWAGPLTLPGETVNGSTIVLSRTGKVESGQHSLAGEILAYQMWMKNKQAYPFWENSETGPVIETIIIKGVSEDPRVLMTVDNCKPRSEADVFYTSELFRKLMPADRKECSRMLATAVDLLWKRTDTKGYKTHSEVVQFVDRHKKILKCIEHIFVEDSAKGGRKISKLRIRSGDAAALCYLMGCSGKDTDGDVYRNGFPPTEKGLDWSRFDRAKQFWALIGGSKQFAVVRSALGKLMDSSLDNEANTGMGGRLPEKLAIIQKAWDCWVDCENDMEPFTEDDLADGGRLNLTYINWRFDPKLQTNVNLPDGQLALQDVADFQGIDCPEQSVTPTADPPVPMFTPEQLEQAKADAKAKTQQQATAHQQAAQLVKNMQPGKPVAV